MSLEMLDDDEFFDCLDKNEETMDLNMLQAFRPSLSPFGVSQVKQGKPFSLWVPMGPTTHVPFDPWVTQAVDEDSWGDTAKLIQDNFASSFDKVHLEIGKLRQELQVVAAIRGSMTSDVPSESASSVGSSVKTVHEVQPHSLYAVVGVENCRGSWAVDVVGEIFEKPPGAPSPCHNGNEPPPVTGQSETASLNPCRNGDETSRPQVSTTPKASKPFCSYPATARQTCGQIDAETIGTIPTNDLIENLHALVWLKTVTSRRLRPRDLGRIKLLTLGKMTQLARIKLQVLGGITQWLKGEVDLGRIGCPPGLVQDKTIQYAKLKLDDVELDIVDDKANLQLIIPQKIFEDSDFGRAYVVPTARLPQSEMPQSEPPITERCVERFDFGQKPKTISRSTPRTTTWTSSARSTPTRTTRQRTLIRGLTPTRTTRKRWKSTGFVLKIQIPKRMSGYVWKKI